MAPWVGDALRAWSGLLTNSAASFRKKKRSANSQHARSAATPVQVDALIDDALRTMTLRARACTESLLNWSAAPPSMPRGTANSEPSLHGAAWRCPALGASHAQSYDAGASADSARARMLSRSACARCRRRHVFSAFRRAISASRESVGQSVCVCLFISGVVLDDRRVDVPRAASAVVLAKLE